MKRTVKAWIGMSDGEPMLWPVEKNYDVYSSRLAARGDYEHVVPCTITYDDGKPKRKRKDRGNA